MDLIIETIDNNNLNIIKAIHQIKNYEDFYINDILNDVKESLITTSSIYRKETGDLSKFNICEEHVVQLNELKGSNDREKIINLLENIIKRQNTFKEEYKNKILEKYNDYDKLLMETYYDIENILFESYSELLYEESDYISNLIYEICTVTEAGVGKTTVNTAKTAGKVFKGAVKVWQTLLNFINKIKEMFMTKIKKIQERDAAWLKQNKKTLLNVDTTNKEVNIHSDYNIPFSSAKTTMKSFRNMVTSNSKLTDHTVFREKLRAYTTQNGDLKVGLSNKFRTNNPNKEYTIVTISGKPISNTIPLLIKFCEEYISSVNDMNKEFKDSETFIKQLEREMRNREIVMDNYCYVEEMYYSEMDLGLYIDFDSVFEAEGEKVNTGAQDTTGTNNNNTNSQKKEKVGVNDRDRVKEKTDKMTDNQLKVYHKICTDMNLGLSTYLTTMEKKYFESITILRGLIK